MRNIHLFCCAMLVLGQLSAQQDPTLTSYHFNALLFNPAYAGSHEHLTVNLTHRQQWLGLEGAPVTQVLSGHMPLQNDRVGLGLTLMNDQVGPGGATELSGAYAYRIQVGAQKQFKLSVGLQAGLANWRSRLSTVKVADTDDASFNQNLSRWLPNFGAGAYLYNKQFYAGVAVPRLLEYDLSQDNQQAAQINARNVRHWYLTLGGAIPLNGEELVFRPNLLLQHAGFFSKTGNNQIGSPTSLNLGASFLFRQLFWAGLTYRTALAKNSSTDSANLWLSWSLRNGMRFGAAYDITLSKLRTASSNSFEIMLGYEFDVKVKQVVSPRYF
ncbi:MAG TPA: type IX secretion system membrane protein PorP/SprF [Saprospiraceae bacterium]|nr:type IX secretion system membrane protein PorP/SprF [Saprospiraceae bacterium]